MPNGTMGWVWRYELRSKYTRELWASGSTPAQKAAAEVSRERAAFKAEKAQAADERLMADAITAGPELQRRLRQKLQRSGRLLLLGGRTNTRIGLSFRS